MCHIFSKLIHLQWELTSPADAEFTGVVVFGVFVHEITKHCEGKR